MYAIYWSANVLFAAIKAFILNCFLLCKWYCNVAFRSTLQNEYWSQKRDRYSYVTTSIFGLAPGSDQKIIRKTDYIFINEGIHMRQIYSC